MGKGTKTSEASHEKTSESDNHEAPALPLSTFSAKREHVLVKAHTLANETEPEFY